MVPKFSRISSSILHRPTDELNIIYKMSKHFLSAVACRKLEFKQFGEPVKVVELVEEILPPIQSTEVLLKFIAAPINPADINCVQGVYPIKPSLPAVGGFEGVADVLSVGSDVTNLEEGDRVIPDAVPFGTWRTHGVFSAKSVMKVSKEVDAIKMAGISSNPSTAYRMLKDFVNLKSNDVVIQNGANGACGQNVIQLCRAWNIKSVNVVRNRADIDELKNYLKQLGADYVLAEEEIRTTELFKSGECAKPKLALNSVGGKNATDVLRQLDSGGVMVTYGGMSREPVVIPTASFIFKDLSFRGYWMARWTNKNRDSPLRRQMMDELSELMRMDKLKAPAHKLIPISQFKHALANTMNIQGFAGCKYILDLN